MVFVTLQIHLRGILSEKDERHVSDCLKKAKTQDQKDDCRERTDGDAPSEDE